MEYIELIGAVLGSGALSSVITSLVNRKQAKADAKHVEADTQIDVAKAAMDYADRIEKNFNNRLTDLTQEIIGLKAENVQLRLKIDNLVDENVKLRVEVGKLTNK